MVASVNDALCLADNLNLFSEATLCVSGRNVPLQESSSHDTVQSQCFADSKFKIPALLEQILA